MEGPLKCRKHCKRTILKLVTSFLLLLWMGIWIPIATICIPYRCMVFITAKVFRKDLISFQTWNNQRLAVGKALSRKPLFNMLCCFVVKGDVPIQDFRSLFVSRVLSARDSNDDFVYRKLWQTYDHFMGYGFLQKVVEFDLEHHVRDWDDGGKFELPEICSCQDFCEITDDFLRLPWKEGVSPWECVLIHGFQCEGGGIGMAVIFRWDHTLADGYSMYGLLRRLWDPAQGLKKEMNLTRKFTIWDAIKTLAFPANMVWDYASLLVENWAECWGDGRLATKCHNSLSKPVSAKLVKDIKNSLGVNYFVVVLASISQALYRIHKDGGKTPSEVIQFDFPLPKTGHHGGMRNHMHLGRMAVKIQPEYSIQNLKEMDSNFKLARNSYSRYYLELTLMMVCLIPNFLWKPFAEYFRCNSLLVANFPVINEALTFDNLDVVDGWSSGAATCPELTISAAVSTFGMCNQHRFYITMDKNLFPSQAKFQNFGAYIEDALLKLKGGIANMKETE